MHLPPRFCPIWIPPPCVPEFQTDKLAPGLGDGQSIGSIMVVGKPGKIDASRGNQQWLGPSALLSAAATSIPGLTASDLLSDSFLIS